MLPHCVVPLPGALKLRVGDECDKMASNIGYFRNWAGVHYRSDAWTWANSVLRDAVQRYSYPAGFRWQCSTLILTAYPKCCRRRTTPPNLTGTAEFEKALTSS